MKKIKLSVSIGIPAYNEEANIRNLLLSLLAQNQNGFILKEIIVISDGSTDRTVEAVSNLIDKRIKLYRHKNRKGQQTRQNEIISRFKGNILVLLEADTLPANIYYLQNLVQPMVVNKKHNIGIIFGNSTPLKPKSFFENIMFFKAALKEKIQSNHDSKSWIDASGHRGKAFSKMFAKKISWVDDAPEDSYSLLLCKRKGFEIEYSPKARIYHRLPGNFQDYYRQYTKFIRGRRALLKYFPQNEITKLNNYRFPISTSIKEIIKTTIKNPLMMFLYICVLTTVHLRNLKIANFDPLLDVYMSTKKLKS